MYADCIMIGINSFKGSDGGWVVIFAPGCWSCTILADNAACQACGLSSIALRVELEKIAKKNLSFPGNLADRYLARTTQKKAGCTSGA